MSTKKRPPDPNDVPPFNSEDMVVPDPSVPPEPAPAIEFDRVPRRGLHVIPRRQPRLEPRKSRSIRLDGDLDVALQRLAKLWGLDVNSAVSVAVSEACRKRGLIGKKG